MPVEFILPVQFQPTKIDSSVIVIRVSKAAPFFFFENVLSRHLTQTG